MSNKVPYLPKQRRYLNQKPMSIKAFSPSGNDYTELPDPVRDPIVCNNIAWQEFDYTYDDLDDPYDDSFDNPNKFD